MLDLKHSTNQMLRVSSRVVNFYEVLSPCLTNEVDQTQSIIETIKKFGVFQFNFNVVSFCFGFFYIYPLH